MEGATTEMQTTSTSAFSTSVEQLAGDQIGQGHFAPQALLARQLNEHRAGEFVAIRARGQAENAAVGVAAPAWSVLSFAASASIFDATWGRVPEVFDDVAQCFARRVIAAPRPAAPAGDRSPPR